MERMIHYADIWDFKPDGERSVCGQKGACGYLDGQRSQFWQILSLSTDIYASSL